MWAVYLRTRPTVIYTESRGQPCRVPTHACSASSSLCSAAGGNAAPLSGGFSLPIVSNQAEILPAAGDADHNLTHVRPRIDPLVFPIFSVVVGVGAGQHRHYYKLALDFVESLTWTQCRPSNPEVRQQGPVYDSAASRHFKYVKPTDAACTAPFIRHGRDKCSFGLRFQAAAAQDYLATDEFTFASSTGGVNTVSDLVFGCSHATRGFHKHHVYAGVMSLNQHPNSFFYQLSRRGVANWRFSYCLVSQAHARSGRHGYLRFGSDVPDTSPARNTALLYGRTTTLYYVSLAGISLDGRRLTGITPEMFRRDPYTHHSGTIVDAGTPMTKIIRPAYAILEAEVSAHLRRRGGRVAQVPGHRLCFEAANIRPDYLPSMTLQFQEPGAKLDIKPKLLFMAVQHGQRAHVCLGVVPDAARTVIGAGQQADTRFTFDLGRSRLYFVPEQCHQDA